MTPRYRTKVAHVTSALDSAFFAEIDELDDIGNAIEDCDTDESASKYFFGSSHGLS